MVELPDEVVEEAERLTRLARGAVDDSEAAAHREHRDALLAEYGYASRVREDADGATLICYPVEWADEAGTVRVERIDDTDRAVEVSLTGAGDAEDWALVEEHNRDVAARVRERHGDVHGDNAAAFADFMGNHYARRVESASAAELREFVDEYFPRNAWPTDAQRSAVERSLELVFEVAGETRPDLE